MLFQTIAFSKFLFLFLLLFATNQRDCFIYQIIIYHIYLFIKTFTVQFSLRAYNEKSVSYSIYVIDSKPKLKL